MTTGGSRLSLLARQLSTTTVLAQGELPEAPAPMQGNELAPPPSSVPMPDGQRNREASEMARRDQLRRGAGVRSPLKPSKSSGLLKWVAVVLALLAVAGGGWYYRVPARAFLLSLLQPSQPALPTKPGGVPQLTPPPAPAPKPQSTTQELVQTPSLTPSPDKPQITIADTLPKPPSANGATTSDAPTIAPSPPSVRKPDEMNTVPAADSTPPIAMAPTPSPAPAPNEPPPPPRALEVLDDPAPTEMPQPEIRPALPQNQKVATLTPNNSKALVEVNVPDKTGTAPKPIDTPTSTPGIGPGPKINNCPPNAKAALEGLLGFLNAESQAQRLPFMQQTEGIQAKADMYYRSNPDGPIAVSEINFLRRDASPEVGKGTHTVFVLDSRNWAYPIPVMLEENETGARVDWLSFIEFKDDLLKRFFSGYLEHPARFHVAIRRTHYFNDDVPDVENKECYEITNAMGSVNAHVFVPKPSPLATSLATSITWDKAAVFPIVELQWRKEPGFQWVEMTAVPQLNWYSAAAKTGP